MRVLVMCTLLLVATLAATSSAEARPEPPQCVHGGISYTVGPVTVSNYCGEGPRLDVDEDCLRDGTC